MLLEERSEGELLPFYYVRKPHIKVGRFFLLFFFVAPRAALANKLFFDGGYQRGHGHGIAGCNEKIH